MNIPSLVASQNVIASSIGALVPVAPVEVRFLHFNLECDCSAGAHVQSTRKVETTGSFSSQWGGGHIPAVLSAAPIVVRVLISNIRLFSSMYALVNV